MVQSYAPKASTVPLSTGSNAVSIEVLGSLDPNQATGNFEMSNQPLVLDHLSYYLYIRI